MWHHQNSPVSWMLFAISFHLEDSDSICERFPSPLPLWKGKQILSHCKQNISHWNVYGHWHKKLICLHSQAWSRLIISTVPKCTLGDTERWTLGVRSSKRENRKVDLISFDIVIKIKVVKFDSPSMYSKKSRITCL